MRKKNPHPQRAVNARTVLKCDFREEKGGEEEGDVERLRRMLACVPCRDVVKEQNQKREEETTFVARGVKRKRGHECDVCGKMFAKTIRVWPYTCVFTRTRNRTNVMCARSVLVNLVICKAHAYSHERETV